MTLTEFLLARFIDDEVAAMAGPPAPWRVATLDDEAAAHDEDTWAGETVAAADGIAVANPYALSGRQTRAVRDHIVRHDPARVLAEVEAKRRIVELRQGADAPEHPSAFTRGQDDGFRQGLDEALRALAVVYAGHPDYDPRWAL